MNYRIKPGSMCDGCTTPDPCCKHTLADIIDSQVFKNPGDGRLVISVHGVGDCGGLCEVEEVA